MHSKHRNSKSMFRLILENVKHVLAYLLQHNIGNKFIIIYGHTSSFGIGPHSSL